MRKDTSSNEAQVLQVAKDQNKNACPPHEYKEVIYKTQEAKTGHWNYAEHLITTLTHEHVKLFCIKCGSLINIIGKEKS